MWLQTSIVSCFCLRLCLPQGFVRLLEDCSIRVEASQGIYCRLLVRRALFFCWCSHQFIKALGTEANNLAINGLCWFAWIIICVNWICISAELHHGLAEICETWAFNYARQPTSSFLLLWLMSNFLSSKIMILTFEHCSAGAMWKMKLLQITM